MPMKQKVSRTDKAWLAGIIDGEGCLIFNPVPKRNHHYCKLQVTNTDEGILNEVQRILSEWLVPFCLTIASSSRKPCFHILVCRRQEIVFVLRMVEPYLKSVKRQKAILMIDYIEQLRVDGKRSNNIPKVYHLVEKV